MLIVVKIGGNVAVEIASSGLIEDLKNVLSENKVILVHGGGDEVTEVASKLGKEQKFVVSPEGFRSRYTDKETVEIYAMVIVGKINKQIVSILQSKGVPAVGLSGVDGSLIKADRKKRIIVVDEQGRKRVIDGGYTGKITEVNVSLINFLMDKGYVPVIAPLAIGEEFEFLNVDADRTAACIAGALRADRLLLLTDVDGLILDGKVVPKLNLSEAEQTLPKIGHGMI
ncbi:MAG: [LysW]-aminoadipate/[LysW]-glutamate kinase, partial [Candidatus Bathyarchaeia archaeon]